MAYDFMTLSPEDFEALVADIFSAQWHTTLESFNQGKDKGIDLRHSRLLEGEELAIVQCKRYAPHKFSELLRSIKKEKIKVELLNPMRYVLVTSVKLSPGNKESLLNVLSPWCKGSQDIYGPDELNTLLRLHPHVEKAHFKLWISNTVVLERVVNAKIFAITDATIASTKHMLSKLVTHEGFPIAIKMLDEHHHLMIVGNPGIGKTTLARMLMCHYMQFNFEPIWVVSNIEDAWVLVHTASMDGRNLIVVYDDFLGRLQYNSLRFGKNEEHSLMELLAKVERSRNLRLILTTREYILADAKRMHGAFELRGHDILRFTLSLQNYTQKHKAEMLFNHLYFSDLSDQRLLKLVKTRIYQDIVMHQHFNPRIVESISKRANSDALTDNQYLQFVQQEFDNPSKLWLHPFCNEISVYARQLLIALWSFDGTAELTELRKTVFSLNKSLAMEELSRDFDDALKQLDGNFIKTNRFPAFDARPVDFIVVEFQNPSVEEFIESQIKKDAIWIARLSGCVHAMTQISKLVMQMAKSELEKGVQQEICSELRARASGKVSVFRSYITNVLYDDRSLPTRAWVTTQLSPATILQELLILEITGAFEDEYTYELKSNVLTVAGWTSLFASLRSSELDAYPIHSLQTWIFKKSGWPFEEILEAQKCLRVAFFDAMDLHLPLTISGLTSVVEAASYVPCEWIYDFPRKLILAIQKEVRDTIDRSRSFRDADKLLEYVNELKALESIFNIDLEGAISELLGRYEQLDGSLHISKYKDERVKVMSANEIPFDIDRLFSGLLER